MEVKSDSKELLGELLIDVVESKDLSGSSFVFKSDYRGATKKSKEQKGKEKWNAKFCFLVNDSSDKIVIKVEDSKKKSLGSCSISITEKLTNKSWEDDVWYSD
jgi:hypothetical protein